ncbi:serine/threonine-protein kinase ULK3 isoform X2 [Fopius arisanus]|uniref:Serine/threonine-protein kinase ULK3 n=1 Tax=Fopius arisanus TaxID=64838 RepID=A0A9R1TS40_9HYME|nr:PREDICTED: serine/threonine-protein kinase ULK3 isoform X2 [Fopius arisanus]
MSSPTLNDYTILEKIGTGSYATVHRAVKKGGNREIVAIKCVDSTSLSKSAIENLLCEINLLKILKHENIVRMEDFFYHEGRIYIVMEYCNAGDLSSFIKRKSQLPETVCRKFLQQLALALRYMRSHNVCHMDLKPQNLLLTTKPVLTLKVGDFGFAQYLSTSESKFSIRGSPLYMAPEILLRHEYDARVDLWSVGVIMYECLFGKAPYSSSSFEELGEKIKTCKPIEIPKGCYISPECKNLLTSLLKHDPNERLSFADFFGHEFLDLAHAPTEENHEKAITLIQSAVKADSEGNKQEASHLYCEALRYLIPQLTNEADPNKKKHLRMRVNEYINRAEKLKFMCMRSSSTEESNSQSNDAERVHSLPRRTLRTTSVPYRELPLEMGETGEQYLAEGSYDLALERLKSCLGILVPLINKEPPGRRRELLNHQIQIWMKQAECTKGLLATQVVDDYPKEVKHLHDQCSLQ